MKELLTIFAAFSKIGALTFGGGYTVLPLMQKDIADRRGWATYEEITDYYAVSQCLPGLIAMNTSMLIGHKLKGKPGMLAAGLGIAFPSVVIILIIAAFIQNFMQYAMVRHAFNGIRVTVAVLIVNAVVKLWKSGVKDAFGIVIFAGALAAMLLTGLSPIIPVLAGAAAGVVIKELNLTRDYKEGK
jgi:chromate transporter